MRYLLLGLLLGSTFVLAADLPRTAAPEGAAVYIIIPAHGEVVTSPVRVVFGLKNMGIAPAGVQREASGHHHLLIDTDLPDLDLPIPASTKHLHFGKGQSETIIELPPGEHTLQLLLGDALHIPHQPPVMSKPISIIVRP